MRINSTNNSVLGIKIQGQERRIEEGDTIKGKVTDISRNKMIIKTSTGQTISASFNNSLEFNLGQTVELFVNSIFEDQVFAELKDINNKNSKPLGLNEKISSILNEINIPVKQDTINFAKMLFKYDMPINKETIQRIIELQGSIKSLSENITPEKIISLLFIADQANDIPADILNKMVLLNQNSIKEAYTNEGMDLKSLNNDSDVKDKTLSILKNMNIPIDNSMNNLISKATSIFEGLSVDDIKNVLFLISNDIEVTPKNLIELANNIENNIKIGDILNKLLEKIESIESNGEEFSEIKSNIKKLFIIPEKLQDSSYIEDKIKDIFLLGKSIEEGLHKKFFYDIEFNKLLNEIRDKLNFIKVVNENNHYLHMPLLLNNQRSTLDIYIVNDKKNQNQKKLNNENATVLLSLDLKNIGHIESMVTIERKNVSLVFRTDDNKIKDLINSKLISLNHLLKEKGYALIASKVTNIDERFSLNTISDMQRQDKLKDFHLDLRV